MQIIKKFLCALIVCTMAVPLAVHAEYETVPVGHVYNIIPFADNSTVNNNIGGEPDVDGAIDYILEQLAENQPYTIDISRFNIPQLVDSNGNRIEATAEFYSKLQHALRFEHPELFYLSNYFSYYYNPDAQPPSITELSLETIKVQDTDAGGNPIIVNMEGYKIKSKAEIERRKELIRSETNRILSLITDDMTPLQKVLLVHDYIVQNYKYDQSYQSRSLDNMIIKKKGVCEGYTHLFYYIMRELDIPCVEVPSDACAHIWNKVQLDGEWYNIDVTHDDVTYGNSHDDTSYDYSAGNKRSHFLISDEELMLLERDPENRAYNRSIE